MLTAHAIQEARLQGQISICPFHEDQLQANSYDLTLAPTVVQLLGTHFDLTKEPPCVEVPVSGGRLILDGGGCYLATHNEYVGASNLIMMLHGRSTLARYFVSIHETAGFGDVGYRGHWTMEIYPKRDIVLYVGMRIAQISFHLPVGKIDLRYHGRYVTGKSVPMLPVPNNF